MSAVPKVPQNVTAGQAQSQLVKDRTRALGSADADSKYGNMWWSVRIQGQPLLKCLIKNGTCDSLLRHFRFIVDEQKEESESFLPALVAHTGINMLTGLSTS